ncbi:MAG: hypothetical protein KatS3mg115_2382 [Candidatus Poribacteria bacterium]|nr:MAG: hypothetical protein KatS3mg115_2382 [Candidatus Poribacteria bacterium]
MNRLYVVESTVTVTGASADHRLPLRAGEIGRFVVALAAALGVPGAQGSWPEHERWIRAVAEDLKAHPGACAVLAGPNQPPAVHALIHLINYHLGNVGKTVVHTEPIEQHGVRYAQELAQLVEELNAGAVELLVVLDSNPVYTAPQDVGFAEALARAKLSVHMGLYLDETGSRCDWHVPMTHSLEAWGDVRAYDGTATIVQPLIRPLYGGVSPLELLEVLAGGFRTPYEIVRATWQEGFAGQDFEFWWRKSVHDGVVPDTQAAPLEVFPVVDAAGLMLPASSSGDAIEINFRPDPTVADGRYANNAWLQETPKPITKLTWDNAALVAPALAERLDLQNGDLCEFHFGGGKLTAAVWILPGQPDGAVTQTLGYGRQQAGNVGSGTGFNALRAPEPGGPLVWKRVDRCAHRQAGTGWSAPSTTIALRGATSSERGPSRPTWRTLAR